MKEITLTCPFTGGNFTALQDTDGNLYVKHALTNEDIKINWNNSIKRYNIPKNAFKHIETVNMSVAAEILGVSKQRISQIANDQIIPSFIVNETRLFRYDDVVEYRDNRTVGRPKKC